METGQIISAFARLEASQEIALDHSYHAGIPGECMDIIDRAYQKEWRKLERELGVDFDLFMDDLHERGFNAKRIYDSAVGRIMWRYENA